MILLPLIFLSLYEGLLPLHCYTHTCVFKQLSYKLGKIWNVCFNEYNCYGMIVSMSIIAINEGLLVVHLKLVSDQQVGMLFLYINTNQYLKVFSPSWHYNHQYGTTILLLNHQYKYIGTANCDLSSNNRHERIGDGSPQSVFHERSILKVLISFIQQS